MCSSKSLGFDSPNFGGQVHTVQSSDFEWVIRRWTVGLDPQNSPTLSEIPDLYFFYFFTVYSLDTVQKSHNVRIGVLMKINGLVLFCFPMNFSSIGNHKGSS